MLLSAARQEGLYLIDGALLQILQITLLGFSFVILNFLSVLWYAPGLDADCPLWIYKTWAAGLFLYQTFDAVDGTQAYVSFLFFWRDWRKRRELLKRELTNWLLLLEGEPVRADRLESCSIMVSNHWVQYGKGRENWIFDDLTLRR